MPDDRSLLRTMTTDEVSRLDSYRPLQAREVKREAEEPSASSFDAAGPPSSGHASLVPSGAKPSKDEDSQLAWKLQRELNGLRGSGRRSRSAGVAKPSASTLASPDAAGDTGGKPLAAQLKAAKVPAKPMIFHEPTGLWYRATIASARQGEVLVSWDGKDEWAPVWVSQSSAFIWRGTMRAKDWKHVGGGGWLPRKGSSAGKGGPRTPPLSSPRHSSSEECESADTASKLSEGDAEIACTEISSPRKSFPAKRKHADSPDEPTPAARGHKSAKAAKLECDLRSAFDLVGEKQSPEETFAEIKRQGARVPIKVLMKRAYRSC